MLDYAAFFLATGSSMMPMMSDSFMIRSSWPSILTSVPDHLPNSTVANLDVDGDELPILVAAAWADGDDLALGGFFLGGVRNDDATCRLILGIDALNDDAVVERTKLHGVSYAMGNEDWMEREPRDHPGRRLGRSLALPGLDCQGGY